MKDKKYNHPYLLPFTTIVDLDRNYKLLLRASEEMEEETVLELEKAKIPYTRMEIGFGVAIDVSKVPVDINLKELLEKHHGIFYSAIEKMGAIKNPDAEL